MRHLRLALSRETRHMLMTTALTAPGVGACLIGVAAGLAVLAEACK